MAEQTIFERIVAREIPAEIVLEDDELIAFTDIAPKAEMHVLVVPKTSAYRDVVELAAGDPDLLASMVRAARAIALERAAGDFRLIFNSGASAGQTVFHVHAHVLAGADLTEESLA
ncbi:histidine triad nucleotide-binding protein [Agrococcus versicolor]|uniref:Histidine triad nucleotide-binding protein n=1 Tax=Agrococcus versicolor TaxID=501482 RepID=A0ABN3AVC2_9MICO